MAHQHVLIDVDAGIYRDGATCDSEDQPLAGAETWSVAMRRLRGGLSDGVDVVDIDNGELSLAVLPTRGMGIWRGELHGTPIGWDSPAKRPVHPAFVDQSRRGGIGWLDGFNELLCRCGLASNGPPCDDGGEQLTVHGRVANIPAHRLVLDVDPDGRGTIRLTGVVDEMSLFGTSLRLTSTLETVAGSNGFAIEDTVTNTGSRPAEMELLYHLNLGPPFLEEGSRFRAAMDTVEPRDDRAAEGFENWSLYGPPESGYAEQVYFGTLRDREPGRSTVLLHNAAADLGLSLDVETTSLPYFTLWKNTAAVEDGYVTGLEPSTSYPNTRPAEREAGRLVVLEPGESRTFRFGCAVHDSAAAVSDVVTAIGET